MTTPSVRTLTFLLAGLACAGIGAPAAAAAGPFRILHHETLQIEASSGAGVTERVSFVAYGRRFDLQLEPNERVQRAFGSRRGGGGVVALRGTVEGDARSWVRLTRSPGGRWHGMFFDGTDVYAVEPVEDVSAELVQPAGAAGAAPVIFRLADALLPVGAAQCGTSTLGHEASALEAFESLAAGDGAQTASQAGEPAAGQATKRLLVGVVADFEFAQFFDSAGGPTAEEAIVQRMNIVDGIFSAQLGVKIELAAPTVFRTGNDPFSSSNANSLLEELRRYRAGSGKEMGHGITHLMTGRDMEGETVGVAYLGSVCGGGAASSLSEGTRSSTSAALIAAHELGHNFNAPHDGDTGGACAATTANFIMAPRLNGSQTFSSCSLEQMSALVTGGSCLTDIAPQESPVTPPEPPAIPPAGDGAASGGGGTGGFALVLALLGAAGLRRVSRGARPADL